jgi:hypothetical protein
MLLAVVGRPADERVLIPIFPPAAEVVFEA